MIRGIRRREVVTDAEPRFHWPELAARLELRPVEVGPHCQYHSPEEYLAKTHVGLQNVIIVQQENSMLYITSRYAPKGLTCTGKPCTYMFNLNRETKGLVATTGARCYSTLKRYYDIPDASIYTPIKDLLIKTPNGTYAASCAAEIGFRGDDDHKYSLHDCYEYDLNSAFSAQLLNGMPDLFKPDYSGRVKPGQVGFLITAIDRVRIDEVGALCDIAFPRLNSTPEGLLRFINHWYDIKKKSTGAEKAKAKARLNYSIGFAQRRNPFFRAFIIRKCNAYIKSVMDSDTILWNTDAIFSTKRRYDLPIGKEIGQFKEIAIKRLVYRGNTYQINDELPTWRGIPKAWFTAYEQRTGHPFDFATEDRPPDNANQYVFDPKTLVLKENDCYAKI